MSQRSRPFGDLHKVRGPGTKLQQGKDKTPVCADGTAREGQRRQLGLARRGYGQEQTKAARLGWREGAKAREAGPGKTGSEQLGCGQLRQGAGPGHQSLACPNKTAPGLQGPGLQCRTQQCARAAASACACLEGQPGGQLGRPPGAPSQGLTEDSTSARLPQKTREWGGGRV